MFPGVSRHIRAMHRSYILHIYLKQGYIHRVFDIENKNVMHTNHFIFCENVYTLQTPRDPNADGRVKSNATSSRHVSIEVPTIPTLAIRGKAITWGSWKPCCFWMLYTFTGIAFNSVGRMSWCFFLCSLPECSWGTSRMARLISPRPLKTSTNSRSLKGQSVHPMGFMESNISQKNRQSKFDEFQSNIHSMGDLLVPLDQQR